MPLVVEIIKESPHFIPLIGALALYPVGIMEGGGGFILPRLGLSPVYGLETLPQFGHKVRAFLRRNPATDFRIWARSEGRLRAPK